MTVKQAETLGGFIIEEAGRILMNNEFIEVGNLKLIIESSDNRRIKMIKVEIPKMKYLILLSFSLVFLLAKKNYTIPKPPTYLRLELPEHTYRNYQDDCPYEFSIAKSSRK